MGFRFTHVSDTHSSLPDLGKNSILLIHSGDFFNNLTRGYVKPELRYQERWLEENISDVKDWIGDRVFVYCAGNHDYFDPIPFMKENGILAFNITNRMETILDLKMYGFPYVPFMKGEWNYEKRNAEMSDLVDQIPEGLDILVTHCPPYGILAEDDDKQEGGNSPLINWLNYKAESLPQYLLCGHFHNSSGIYVETSGMIVSNAATTVHHFQYR